MRIIAILLVTVSVGSGVTGCGSREVSLGEGAGSEPQSALFSAIEKGDLEAVRQELAGNPALVNQPQGRFFWTPLHKAAATDQVEIARLLLENGANVNAFDALRMTPLVVALDVGASDEFCELLRSAGGDD